MRACSKCGSVSLQPRISKTGRTFECKNPSCGHKGPQRDFPHLHNQVDTHVFKSHTTTGPGSHRINPAGNKHS